MIIITTNCTATAQTIKLNRILVLGTVHYLRLFVTIRYCSTTIRRYSQLFVTIPAYSTTFPDYPSLFATICTNSLFAIRVFQTPVNNTMDTQQQSRRSLERSVLLQTPLAHLKPTKNANFPTCRTDNSIPCRVLRKENFMLKLEMTLHFLSGITFFRHANLGRLLPVIVALPP